MSVTTGMSKTLGARQHNRGWMTMLRDERRKEAVARQLAYQANKPHPCTPEEAVAALKEKLADA
jgi:hypothetical protein